MSPRVFPRKTKEGEKEETAWLSMMNERSESAYDEKFFVIRS
jgi:hypothetical protein